MSQPERFEVLIVGSGQGGKLLAWHMARSGWDLVRSYYPAGAFGP